MGHALGGLSDQRLGRPQAAVQHRVPGRGVEVGPGGDVLGPGVDDDDVEWTERGRRVVEEVGDEMIEMGGLGDGEVALDQMGHAAGGPYRRGGRLRPGAVAAPVDGDVVARVGEGGGDG